LSRHTTVAFLGLVLLVVAAPSRAVEFQLDGYDRTFFRLFNDLSLDRDAEQAEGTRSYFEQRLRLNPHLEINPHIHVFGQIDVLDLALYGSGSEVLDSRRLYSLCALKSCRIWWADIGQNPGRSHTYLILNS